MTKVTYIGQSDVRVLRSSDFPQFDDDFEDLVWEPHQTLEVPDHVAEHITEMYRTQFVLFDDPKNKDHRTKAELMDEARELQISGRSGMDKDQLADAISARRMEISNDQATSGVTEEPERAIPHTQIDDGDEFVDESIPETPHVTQERTDPI